MRRVLVKVAPDVDQYVVWCDDVPFRVASRTDFVRTPAENARLFWEEFTAPRGARGLSSPVAHQRWFTPAHVELADQHGSCSLIRDTTCFPFDANHGLRMWSETGWFEVFRPDFPQFVADYFPTLEAWQSAGATAPLEEEPAIRQHLHPLRRH